MPLIASVTVASFAATDGEIAAIKSSTPTAPMIALVFISTTSGTDYTAHRPRALAPTKRTARTHPRARYPRPLPMSSKRLPRGFGMSVTLSVRLVV